MADAEYFNKKAADPDHKPEEIIEALDLKKGQTVADLGSGGGYFVLRFASMVGEEGLVFAIDTNRDFLNHVREKASEQGYGNIYAIYADPEQPPGIPGKLDLVFNRNTYHHMNKRIDYFHELRKYLRPDGKLVIIEHDGSKYLGFHRIFGHYTSKKEIKKEMKEAGYWLLDEKGFLDHQCFLVFKPRLD